MALSDVELAKIKVDYESGKLSKRKVAQKYSISRNTLDKHAADKKWIYGYNEPELSQKIERLTFERLISDEVDRATEITNKFLGDIDKYRQLAMIPASELAKAYNEAKVKNGKVPKEEFSRIWESTKAIKTAIEGLNISYLASRKALGMDKDEEIRKARELQQSERAQETKDPLEGKTIEEIENEIKKLE